MKTLMQEFNNLLEEKNSKIILLEWDKSQLEKEKAELKKENAELKKQNEALMIDISKLKENDEQITLIDARGEKIYE